MIAADTSSIIAYLQGDKCADAQSVAQAIIDGRLCLPPIVVTELQSDANAGTPIIALFEELPLLEPTPGFWKRAGQSRQLILNRGHKARIGDSLAAQSCIDHKVPLIARDKDFRHFAKHCGLILA